MALFRLGSFVPTPGVDYGNVQVCIAGQPTEGGDVLGLLTLFSAGALPPLTVCALAIMPYITASIIVQLLRVVIPRFDDLHKEGQSGTAVLTQYTRYLTIFLAVLQATTIITMARTGNLFPGCTVPIIPDDSWTTLVLMIITMTAGTGLIMWLGELVTERGVGNGMSLLIFTSIAASFPAAVQQIGAAEDGVLNVILFLLIATVVIVLIVFVEQSQRRVPVQYAKRIDRKSTRLNSSHVAISYAVF